MHEQSETVERDGKFYNVYGRATPQAGQPLPGEPAYNTMKEAVSAAELRSRRGAEMSLEEFSGGAAPAAAAPTVMSLEEFSGPAAPSRLQQGLASAKRMGGEAAAIADLVLGMPAFLIGTGAQLGATVHARAAGVPGEATPGTLYPFTAFTVGREAGREVGETLGSPLHKLMQMFDSGEAYEQAATTKGMEKLSTALEKAGVWVEESTGGRVSRDALPMFAEVLMAGATGVGSGKPKPAIEPHVQKALREQGVKMREQAEIEAASKMLTPEEFVARLPVQQQINDLLGIRTPAEQARVTRQRRAETKQVFGTRGPGEEPLPPEIEARGTRQYGDIGESVHYADERTAREAAEAARPVGQAEVLDILQKPGEARTPADLTLLRGARGEDVPPTSQAERRAEPRGMPSEAGLRQALEVAQQGGDEPRIARITNQLNELKRAGEQADQLMYSRQQGRVTPEAAGLLGAAGLGAAAGAVLDEDTLRGATLGGATGLAAVLPFIGRGPSVPSRMQQGGAVKAPGGMWHPEAVERLAQPLYEQMARDETPILRDFRDAMKFGPEGKPAPLASKVDSMVRNYLNKYAGTERDPLKDVEIPFGEGTKRWGDVTDATIVTTDKAPGLRQGEKAFELALPNAKEHYTAEGLALQTYLSHVGDYLRQNVDPAKLQQYDLVRAVRETAENDRRVAKEMEKAAAASSKDLPVYKEYPDGYRWVELKLPEKLTEEQKKTVREAKSSETQGAATNDLDIQAADKVYIALDANGKPIKNAYTEEAALGTTPARAYLAGRLAEEGNQMGHCVGGYCEGVASGESRIFSLRDPKGLSHVTVEVGSDAGRSAQEALTFYEQAPAEYRARVKESVPTIQKTPEYQAWVATKQVSPDILQIKGKQNRAPEAKYLPYVQDFVKEGKWGEVGDLGNTGLVREAKTGKYYTPQEARTVGLDWVGTEGDLHADVRNQVDPLPGPGGRERGQIDQRLIVGLGAVGLGGLLGANIGDDPLSGALLGAIAGAALGFTAGGRGRLKEGIESLDYAVGRVTTRIGNYAPELKLDLRRMEEHRMKRTGDYLLRQLPFMKELAKLPESRRQALERAALTGDREKIAELVKGNPALVAGLREYRNVQNELGKELQGRGRFRALAEDYFPRVVKDLPGLLKAIGAVDKTRLEKALAEGQREAQTRGADLTQVEVSAIVNRELLSHRRPQGHLPGYARPRAIEEVTAEIQPFYHTLPEAGFQYIRESVKDLETAKFFGRDLTETVGPRGQRYTNLDLSIGNHVGRLVIEGKLDAAAQADLISMLKSRFSGGERSPSWWTQQIRGLGHLTLLGNMASAAVQTGDTLMAFYSQGPRAAITAVARRLSGNERITVKDYHLADHISQEFLDTSPAVTKGKLTAAGLVAGGALAGAIVSDNKLAGALAGASVGFVAAVGMANAVNKVFKTTGFTLIDNFGKDIHLGAALERYEQLAQTEKGQQKIARKYKQAYGPEYPQLLADLKSHTLSERVRTLLFSELADMQPISVSEMSQMWMDHPNTGRLAMTLKTFMQTQVDIVRRDAYNEFKAGNKARAIRNLTAISLALGVNGAASDAVRDFILGNAVNFSAGDILENALKTVGFSEYVRDKASKAPIRAAVGAFIPPFQIMDWIITRDPKAVQAIPVIGKLYYSWELGGKEEVELREARKAKKEGRETDLSPRAEEYRDQKRERNRLRREQEAR